MRTATIEVIFRRTEIRCMAPHPERHRGPRYQHARHNKLLLLIPFHAEPRRVVMHEEQVRPGMIPAYCPTCRRFTEYELTAPAEPAEAA